MNAVVMAAVAARVLGFLFAALVVLGLWSRRGRFRQAWGFRQALHRAGQRFARGEIDAQTYRRLRDDLRSGARP